MIKKILLLLFVSLILLNLTKLNKRIFQINNANYTNIDLENRIKYLEIIKSNLSKDKIYLDFVSVLLFNENFKENKLKLDKNIIEKYYKLIKEKNDLNEKIIKQNIKYDYQRKIILDMELNKKLVEKKDQINELDLYDIFLEYFIFKNLKKKQKEIIELYLNLNNIKETKIILDENKIKYQYVYKKISDIEKINKKIKNQIINNKSEFTFILNNQIFFGNIVKKIKENFNPLLSFYKIEFHDNIKNELLTCDKLNNKNNNYINKKIIENIEFNDLNVDIKNNLIMKNDKLILNINNEKFYLILCKIEFDEVKLLQHINYEKSVRFASDFEKEFINEKMKLYNYYEYN